MKSSNRLPLAWITLRILVALNWLSGLAIFSCSPQHSSPRNGLFSRARDQTRGPAPVRIMRACGGLRCSDSRVVINNGVLTRLRRSSRRSPRRRLHPRHAYRLNAIAWFVLCAQLVSIAIAATGKFISTPQTRSSWMRDFPNVVALCSPALRPARVFAEGLDARDLRHHLMAIVFKLDDMLHERRMTLTELAERVDITLANLSILKRARRAHALFDA